MNAKQHELADLAKQKKDYTAFAEEIDDLRVLINKGFPEADR